MGAGNFMDEFKRDAVAQITERGYPSKKISARLGSASARIRSMRGSASSRRQCRVTRRRMQRSGD